MLGQLPRLTWFKPGVYAAVLAVTGILMVPLTIPILPPETFIKINAATGGLLAESARNENDLTSELPQHFADRYGWKDMTAAVAQAFETLTPEEKSQACVLTGNYGEAGAIDYYGPELGLPKAISGHNSYYFWGPQGCTGEVIISVARPRRDLEGTLRQC